MTKQTSFLNPSFKKSKKDEQKTQNNPVDSKLQNAKQQPSHPVDSKLQNAKQQPSHPVTNRQNNSTTNKQLNKQKIQPLIEEITKAIVGQEEMIQGILIGLFTGGHVLIEGLPGLAKTLSVSTASKAVSLQFQRVQFTPDLLPSDLIGTMIFNSSTQEFTPKKGPVFTNILLADEINRAPAKVQSALLEAMEEKQVTIGDKSYPLPDPFLVLATQNPIEQEGTYNLPEAQRDRFLFKIKVNYPNETEELAILNLSFKESKKQISSILNSNDIADIKKSIQSLHIDEKVKKYIVDIVLATRNPKHYGFPELEGLIEVGASPRATVNFPKSLLKL